MIYVETELLTSKMHVLVEELVSVIIYCRHHHHWTAVVLRGRGMPPHAVSKLACSVLSSARYCPSGICSGRLSITGWSLLSCFLVVWYPNGDWRGPSVVFEAVYVLCPGTRIFFTLLIMSMTLVLCLTKWLLFLSLYVMLSICLSILVRAAASLFCAFLLSAPVSAP